MKIRHDSRTRDEVITAAEYFESEALGLGSRFLAEIDKAVREIAAAPLT